MSVYEELEPLPRPGRAVLKRAALAALLIVLAAAGATVTALLLELKDNVDVFNRATPQGARLQLDDDLKDVAPGDPQTILVLGSDRRFSDIKAKIPARSDTMILVRLDPDRHVTAVMSVPRDLKVDITTKKGKVTDKLNAAYALGGPALTVRTVSRLMNVDIHHVVNINFGGFRRAVNKLGCVYTEVDRRYFNDNQPPFGGGPDYATIDVKPGYQKLCGQDALDFVRYRHFDTDLVRAARQQEFLRQAKEQIGLGKLFSDRKGLLKIFGRYTQTDIHSQSAILRLLKLAFESAKNPIQEVHFRSSIGESYVTATPEQIAQTRREFIQAKASSGARGTPKPRSRDASRTKAKRSSSRFPGLIDASKAAEDQAIVVGTKVTFPVFVPKLERKGSVYDANKDTPRAYSIADRGGHRFRAYRLVVEAPGVGQYYGIQGTNWRAPPILDNSTEKVKMRGRTYELFYDGNRLRLVAWRTPRAVYWVSNTLLQTLSNKQMLGIARSLTRVGS